MNDDFYPNISHIVCMDKFGIIGISNKMPWHIPDELKYFKKITNNSIVIMGRNTYQSIGGALTDRINIVISSTSGKQDNQNTHVRNTIEEAIELAWYFALKEEKNIFIIGGASIYEQTLPYINKAYITVLDVSYYNKIKETEIDKFVYYPYEQLIDIGFKLTQKEKLKTNEFFYPIYITILGKLNSEITSNQLCKITDFETDVSKME